jgi:alkylation response protein AidB-like acyl-CoA dehydrogenase
MLEPRERHVDGHVPASDPLSPRRAFTSLPRVAQPLVRYEPADPWEEDTATLPAALQRYRRHVRAFAERVLAPRALAFDTRPHRPPDIPDDDAAAVLRAAGRAGLLGDPLPRPFGSADPRLALCSLALTQALKTEELAAVDGGLMLLVCAHSLGATPLILSGELRHLRRVVRAYRACERGEPHLFAFAITEPGAGSDVEEGHGAAVCRPGVRARAVQGGHVLCGRKVFISGGDLADEVVVFAALEGEGMASWTAFVVPRTAPGFRVARTELKMGMRASGAAELELVDVFVPHAGVVGPLRGGWALNRATLNLSRLPVAAMAVGFARAATELALDFACHHRLGRRRLIDFQDVQLELADMIADTAAARAMVWAAAARRQPLQREASAAKFHCTDVGARVATRAMDLLGNHAVLHHERVEKVFRDVRLTQIFEGTNQINRLAVIEDLQELILARITEGR